MHRGKPFVWLLPLPHYEERNTFNLRQDWDYPALRAMIAHCRPVSPAKISIWGISCGGLAVWEAAMQDGHFYQGLVTMSADVLDMHTPRNFLRSSCLASIAATATVCLCVRGAYEVCGLQALCVLEMPQRLGRTPAWCSLTPMTPIQSVSWTIPST